MGEKTIIVINAERLVDEMPPSAIDGDELSIHVVDSEKEAVRLSGSVDPNVILADLSVPSSVRLLDLVDPDRTRCRVVAVVDSDTTRWLARRAGLEVIDQNGGLPDLIYILRNRLELDSPEFSGLSMGVLVVDDDPDICVMIEEYLTLSDAGYSVLTASDVEEALALIESSSFH